MRICRGDTPRSRGCNGGLLAFEHALYPTTIRAIAGDGDHVRIDDRPTNRPIPAWGGEWRPAEQPRDPLDASDGGG